ncbi:cytidylate kinase [Enterococcus sp. 8G7_MSG3316]|uniref:Cytidylate kinase n=1 Tax=Candidatus Enterococcus testudinis TaxID=1834191 RepID=A0A242A7X3_9ENTE|nr:(d)CMP kinase [Enterococcus sp. 8G7_MSG3316]OTN77124.1 cytidylate kinase [Enterococcus sp. 8G7_MSG3316]
MKKINIAIDGPASSGKSTVAKIIANDLGFVYTDTGAMYRSITYLALKTGCGLDDETAIAALIDQYPITFKPKEKGQDVFVGAEEVTEAIRQPQVTNAVSEVSAHPAVRKKLVEQQQAIAANGGVVMDGRDIGTAVLPQAEVKIFLVASVEERAQRRFKENQQKGIDTTFDVLKEEIQQRDYLDSHREVSPLKQADDAVRIDTSGMSIKEVVAAIKQTMTKKGY